jgi:hypothetical protein
MHHSAQSYDEANSAAARYMRERMEEQFQRGRESAAQTIETVLTNVPDDALVRGQSLNFDANGRLRMIAGDSEWNLHSHALGQVAGRVDVPAQYVRKLEQAEEPWRRDLLAHTLNEMYHNGDDRRYLVRSLGGEARGFLSDSYRRLDSRPLLDAFCGATREVGAVLLKGTATEVRVALKVALPMVFEPVKDEIMGFGLEWSNSDYGKGKHAVSVFLWRIWCTNLCTCENSLAQVHLGRKLPDNLALSEETYRLDTETTVSALKDIVGQCLGPPKIKALCAAVKEAHEDEVDWSAASRKLSSVLTKAEQKAVQDAFEGKDVQTLPPGKTKWRLSNAVSLLAGNAEAPERTLELERLAGQIIDTHVKEAA